MTNTEADTRMRVLDTAWTLLRERGTTVAMGEIAQAAGISRQAVYLHFENRAGLLIAMTRRQDHRSGFFGRVAGARALPPVEALQALLRAWCDYIPEILPVARALEAAAITGDEGGGAWHDRMDDLREAFRLAIDRVAADGRLAAGWTIETATDWVWARSHLTNWQHLVGERGWAAGDYADRLTDSILAELVIPAPQR